MPKERRTRAWHWLIVVWFTTMAISLAIKATTDSNVFLRALALFALLVGAFVAGSLFGLRKGRQKLSVQGPNSASASDINT